ncbi:N-acetylmuramoyl-L-alanine amidase [Bifidobacterium adolescentis]
MTGASFAKWRGSPNHYQGRNGLHVDHITLHIMVGRLAGTDSCFMSSSFQAASHYGVGGDGSVYQWVDETQGSWADANWQSDCSGITIEHEGGMGGIPVTDAEVEASARLCADIAR